MASKKAVGKGAVPKFGTHMMINGKPTRGEGADYEVLNPATGQLLVKVPQAAVAQIDSAVKAAAAAFDGWSLATPMERSMMLLKIADRIDANAAELARIESFNCGKPYVRVLNDELPAVADVFRYFAGAVRCMTGTVADEYLPGYTSMIRRDPIGVVGSIAPWNYPLMMAAWKIAPAIGAGNTLVLKPSEQTPLTTLKLAELSADILPPGVLNIVTGMGDPVGSTLINHPAVRMVSLTGSIPTGEKVLQAASKTMKRTHLELGGKAPVIVFDDADLAEVVEGLKVFGYYNAGQD